jgi:hypothetical protein
MLPNTIPRSAFGPHLTAVVVLLTGAYHLSRRKAQRLLHELFAISVSLGAVSSMLLAQLVELCLRAPLRGRLRSRTPRLADRAFLQFGTRQLVR